MKGKFKAFLVGLTALTMCLFTGAFLGCQTPVDERDDTDIVDEKDKANSVSLSQTTLTLTEGGEAVTLTATVKDQDGKTMTGQTLEWTSGDTEVVTVSEGVVTIVGIGQTTITVKVSGTNVQATCSVTVTSSTVSVTGVSLNTNSVNLTVGNTITLTATISPENATNKNVTWSTSNDEVVTVVDGVVTAVGAGTATITVTTQDGGFEAECAVTVKAATVDVESVSLDITNKTLEIGGTVTLKATISPENATNKNVTWSTSNDKVATVENGVVTAIGAGTATITVTTEGGGKTAQCTITVNPAPQVATTITLNKTTLALTEGGEAVTLTATVKDQDGKTMTGQTLEWISGDTEVVTVSGGVVTIVGAGQTTITVKVSGTNVQATCSVTVTSATVAVTGVSLNTNSAKLTVEDTLTLTAIVSPGNATNKAVNWTSDKPEVATVVDGVVTAVGAGTATITVTTADGEYTATCTVTVSEAGATEVPVESVTLDRTSETLEIGGTVTLTATISPDNATNKNVTWKSSDENVATVENGVVTAIGAGTATITVTTEGGGKTATCEITVNPAPQVATTITLDETSLALTEGGEAVTLTATVYDQDGEVMTGQTLEWTSGNTEVVTVSGGVVTIVGAGQTTITVKVADTNVQATCLVTVASSTVAVTGVSLNTSSVNLTVGNTITLTETIEPENATNKNVTWSTSNDEVVTVENGVVTAVGAGTATITVTTVDGNFKAECAVTVKAATVDVESVSLNITEKTLEIDGTVTLTATISPENATNKNVTWSTSDDKVATVENGVVTAIGAGTATITVTTEGGGKTATCEITVKAAAVATEITIDEPSLELTVGDEDVALSATVKDQYGAIMSGQTLEWTSDHEDVVTVDQYGLVSVVGAGTATITVKVVGTNVQATCAVTVNAAPVQEVSYSVNFADTAKWSTTAYGDGTAAVGAGQTVAIGADGTPAATDGIMTLYGGASHFYLQADANVEGYTQSWRINALQQSNGMAARAIQIDLLAYTNAQITVKWRSGGAGGRGIALYTDEQVAAGATNSFRYCVHVRSLYKRRHRNAQDNNIQCIV